MKPAGELRHRMVLQKPGVRVGDTVGGGASPFPSVDTVWAAMEPLSGEELFEARRSHPKVSHKITVRYRDDVKQSWRLKLGERYFDIKSILNVGERSVDLELTCEERPVW